MPLSDTQSIRVRVFGSLDLSSRLARLVNDENTNSITLRDFTRAMWQTFAHGQRVSLTGILHIADDDTASLTVQSIAKL